MPRPSQSASRSRNIARSAGGLVQKVARRECGEGEYARAEVTWVAAHRFPVIVGVQQVALDEILASRFKSSASDLQQSGCSAVSTCSAAFCATVTWLQG